MKQGNSKNTYARPSTGTLVIVSLGCLFLGFFLNFSLKEKELSFISTQLRKYSSCPLKYEGLEISYFFPKIHFKNLQIPPSCLNHLPIPLTFDYLDIQVNGLDFTLFRPIISFAGESQKKFSIQGEVAFSGEDFNLNLKETHVETAFLTKALTPLLSTYLPFQFMINGKLIINTSIKRQKGQLQKLDLNVTSRNLKIPALRIMGMGIPTIDIGNLQIMTAITNDGKNLTLQKVSLGGQEHSLMASLDGNIKLFPLDLVKSQIIAKTKFKISEEILEEMSILKMIPKEFYNDSDGFYYANISHTLEDMRFLPGKKN